MSFGLRPSWLGQPEISNMRNQQHRTIANFKKLSTALLILLCASTINDVAMMAIPVRIVAITVINITYHHHHRHCQNRRQFHTFGSSGESGRDSPGAKWTTVSHFWTLRGVREELSRRGPPGRSSPEGSRDEASKDRKLRVKRPPGKAKSTAVSGRRKFPATSLPEDKIDALTRL